MTNAELVAVLLPVVMLVQSTITLLVSKWMGDIEIKSSDAYFNFGWPLYVLALPIVVPLAVFRCWRKQKANP